MKAIWSQDEASYAGEHVAFERIWSYPKPAQRPHPPILVGGDGPTVLDRVLAYGDGWFPNHRPEKGMYERIEELRRRAQRPVEVQTIGVAADPAELERARAAGIRRVSHWLPSGPRGPVERALDRWEAAIAEFTAG
jgi:alkanesulfonate monooxygenase SsuD/methylene tetrahydromethanopterin reductase-like flavin-dependent oxidoreductase (luciferase family)